MAKHKTQYDCQACGAHFPKWSGQCGECGGWNCLTEVIIVTAKKAEGRLQGYAGEIEAGLTPLNEVPEGQEMRYSTGLPELDRVLGGGLVQGSVVLIGGDPGIGKSTLLTQTLAHLKDDPVLYVTGEESLHQVSLRAKRLGIHAPHLRLLAETQVEKMIALATPFAPKVMVVDSIQTMFTDLLQSAPGSVGQVRESAALLVRFAKRSQTALILVGHVTKEGTLAGPRVLEHMVDAVLYFEGQKDSRFRVMRAIKNRFGAVNELGVFAMTDKGLKTVSHPSAIFLSRTEVDVPGQTVMVTWEGTRPLLIEVQALVDDSSLGNPRRVAVGMDSQRIAMLLAILNRHGGINIHQMDVFLNVVGGVKVTETGADLAVIFALISSLKNKPLDRNLAVFGEVGLGGEIRPVQGGQERIREAQKHGFKRMIVPKGNASKLAIEGMEVVPVTTLQEALNQF